MNIAKTLTSAFVLTVAAASASASEPDFYKGKEIAFIVSAGSGGGYSTYARTLARHMGDHIPGNPSFVIQNMPGGGGLRAANHIYNVAPRDGSLIGLVHTSVVFAPTLDIEGAQFDGRKFSWIGSMDTTDGICVAWHTSDIRTWDDLLNKEFVVGGTGAGSQMETMPRLLNSLFKTNIKIVSGYKGGNNVYLAMERGEVEGRCGGVVTSIRATRPDWFPEKKIFVPIQIALSRSPQFPDVPAIIEFAKDDRTKRILEFALAYQEMDRPVLAPPGVPGERLEILRDAFMETMNDKEFQTEAKKVHLTLDPKRGEAVLKLVESVYNTPKDIKEAAGRAMSP